VGLLRLSTAGESHGPAEVCILEGVPAGLMVTATQINADLARRQQGYGRGGRMAIETDTARILAGVRLGRTLGSPICLVVENQDHVNWLERMSPEPGVGDGGPVVTVPRPGHADLSGLSKYGFHDARNVLERASARETVARVAAGAVCKALLAEVGVQIRGRVVGIGPVVEVAVDYADPGGIDWGAVETSAVACDDAEVSTRMCAAIDEAREGGESLGGVFEIWCWGLCPGVGGYATLSDRLDSRLMGAVGGVPAIKGVEVGPAFHNASLPGSRVHDPTRVSEVGGAACVSRVTNRAGGIEGGMTTGMPVVVRAAMKPIPTMTAPLAAVDISTMTNAVAHYERSDVSAVPAARVVGEAMAAYVLAAAYLEKFGGDSLSQFVGAVRTYESELEDRGLWRRSSS
jgi:chorismate synthase